MPIDLGSTKDWERFLNTLVPNAQIQVDSIEDGKIIFHTGNIGTVQATLQSKIGLQHEVLHAIPKEDAIDSASPEPTNVHEQMLRSVLPLNGLQIMERLFTEEQRKKTNIDKFKAISAASNEGDEISCYVPFSERDGDFGILNDNRLGTIAIRIACADDVAAGTLVLELKRLQSVLSGTETEILKILSGETTAGTEHKEGKKVLVNEFARDVFKVDSYGMDVNITFCYGKLLQALQHHYGVGELPPIITRYGETDSYYCDTTAFLQYMGHTFSPQIVFHHDGKDLHPIAFSAPQAASAKATSTTNTAPKAILELVCDISGSITSDTLKTYRDKLITIVTKFSNEHSNWEVVLTTFNGDVAKPQYFNAQNLTQLRCNIQQMQCGGGTALNDAIYTVFTRVSKVTNGACVAVLLVTDGNENNSVFRGQDASLAIQQSCKTLGGDIDAYFIDVGSSNQAFADFAKALGLKHIKMAQMSDLQALKSLVNEFGVPKIVYEFLEAAFQMRVPEGQVKQSYHAVSETDTLVVDGQTYNISKETWAQWALNALAEFSARDTDPALTELQTQSSMFALEELAAAVLGSTNDTP